jgi:hypothetical protein
LTVNIILISHERKIGKNAMASPMDSQLPADDPSQEISGAISPPIFPNKIREVKKVPKRSKNEEKSSMT